MSPYLGAIVVARDCQIVEYMSLRPGWTSPKHSYALRFLLPHWTLANFRPEQTQSRKVFRRVDLSEQRWACNRMEILSYNFHLINLLVCTTMVRIYIQPPSRMGPDFHLLSIHQDSDFSSSLSVRPLVVHVSEVPPLLRVRPARKGCFSIPI